MRFDETEAGGNGARVEQEANDFAGEILIPAEAERAILAIRTPADAQALAARLGIAPAIVAGRYQHETKQWQFGRSLFHKYEIV